MIRKINIALAVLFVAMFALKGLKTAMQSGGAPAAREETADPSGDVSELAPHVYYEYWVGYTLENPISNRNGVLLDMVRAVFPNATFNLVHGDVSNVVERLRTDSRAVVVGFGDHTALAEFPVAPTPLMNCPLVLMTLRTNPWHYTDFSSLTNLRIVANDAFLDYTDIRSLKKLTENGGANLRILPDGVTKVEMAEMVMKGEADAMVIADLHNSEGAPKDGLTSMRFIQSFRKSSVIASEGTLLYVSGLDADFAKKVIDDFERGIRRIDASGELRRICEYYGTQYEPLHAPDPETAAAP